MYSRVKTLRIRGQRKPDRKILSAEAVIEWG